MPEQWTQEERRELYEMDRAALADAYEHSLAAERSAYEAAEQAKEDRKTVETVFYQRFATRPEPITVVNGVAYWYEGGYRRAPVAE